MMFKISLIIVIIFSVIVHIILVGLDGQINGMIMLINIVVLLLVVLGQIILFHAHGVQRHNINIKEIVDKIIFTIP